ncbi:unnamed protein product [Lepidochelys olivacea]
MTFLSNEKVTNATIPSQTEGERDGRSLSSDASPEASGAKLQSGAAVVLGQPGTEGRQCLAERGFKGKTLLLKVGHCLMEDVAPVTYIHITLKPPKITPTGSI